MSERLSPQISKALLIILADFISDVWMVSILLNFRFFVVVSRTLTVIAITVTFMLLNMFKVQIFG